MSAQRQLKAPAHTADIQRFTFSCAGLASGWLGHTDIQTVAAGYARGNVLTVGVSALYSNPQEFIASSSRIFRRPGRIEATGDERCNGFYSAAS